MFDPAKSVETSALTIAEAPVCCVKWTVQEEGHDHLFATATAVSERCVGALSKISEEKGIGQTSINW